MYYPGLSAPVAWHTDGCLLQFISVPPHDKSLYVAPGLPDDRSTAASITPGAWLVHGGPVPETVMLFGEQAARLHPLARATAHAVAPVDSERIVATHFMWLRQLD